ncbi:hypothetical protein [Niveispirillum sp.]|uniref:hypothetical protein n=1 Tax=Niveispirillum sp. TaxID=1917217 RepID=UPI001B6E0EE6|nr:hypothetical protein [Niveispirillum sp.]MBP7339647.1 hypothetical protein [Niveispirillum sp.]
MTWREIRRRLGEAASLASCALNVLAGTGDREVTLSAGAWELRLRGAWRARWMVPVIDAINRPFNGALHCQRAWAAHWPIWHRLRREAGIGCMGVEDA